MTNDSIIIKLSFSEATMIYYTLGYINTTPEKQKLARVVKMLRYKLGGEDAEEEQ